jgi:hypothetical protein
MKLTFFSTDLQKDPILTSGFPEKPPNPRNFGVTKDLNQAPIVRYSAFWSVIFARRSWNL